MPVPVRKLEEAQRPLPERIVEFLSRSPDQAYSMTEVISGVEGFANAMVVAVLLSMAQQEGEGSGWLESHPLAKQYFLAFAQLEREGKIRRLPYQGLEYFALKAS